MLELGVGSSVHCSSFSIRTDFPSSSSLVVITVSLWSSSETELILKIILEYYSIILCTKIITQSEFKTQFTASAHCSDLLVTHWVLV